MSLLRYFVIILIGLGAIMHHSPGQADGAYDPNRTVIKTFMVAAHEWPPFSSREATYFGIAPRIVSEILQGQGITVSYRFVPWTEALDGVITREFDGALIWVTDDLQRDSFLISEPILEYRTALYYRKDSPEPKSADDVIGLRMGTRSHYIYDITSYRLLRDHTVEPVKGNSDAEQLRNLLEGKIDFYPSPILTDTPLLRHGLGKEEQNALTYSTNLFKFPTPHLVVNRHREGSTELINQFNLRLKRLKNDGTIERYINDLRFTEY